MKKYAAVGWATVLLAFAAALPSYTADVPTPAASEGIKAITKPSKDVVVSFLRPGRIVEVLAAKGDKVQAGQLIARLDDSEEQAVWAQDKLAADSVIEIEAEKAIAAQKAKDVEKYHSYGSTFEYENAVLELEIEKAKIKVAELHHEQAIAKFKQTTIMVEKLKVLSPVSGIVAEEFLKAGESADGGNMKLVRIVQLDPLWVEVNVPRTRALQLNKGDSATVTFSDGKNHAGKVAVVSPTGDSASMGILVRLEVSNPENTPAGDKVLVTFPPLSADVARP